MMNQDESGKPYPRLLDWLRYSCAFMLYMYGMSKLSHSQFNMSSALAQRSVGSLNGYELTWFYYGYSRIYASVLGLTQVAGATLLLFRKTTLLAAAIMLPVMANILLINMFILVNDYGPYFISVLICISLLTILWHQRADLLTLFLLSQNREPVAANRTHVWIRALIVLAVSVFMISVPIMRHYVKR